MESRINDLINAQQVCQFLEELFSLDLKVMQDSKLDLSEIMEEAERILRDIDLRKKRAAEGILSTCKKLKSDCMEPEDRASCNESLSQFERTERGLQELEDYFFFHLHLLFSLFDFIKELRERRVCKIDSILTRLKAEECSKIIGEAAPAECVYVPTGIPIELSELLKKAVDLLLPFYISGDALLTAFKRDLNSNEDAVPRIRRLKSDIDHIIGGTAIYDLDFYPDITRIFSEECPSDPEEFVAMRDKVLARMEWIKAEPSPGDTVRKPIFILTIP